MPEPIVYVDRSEVLEGKLDQLKPAMKELAEFVEANEPQLISYNVYFNEDGTQMSVLHVNPDAASLETHMRVAGPKFPPIGKFIRLQAIDVYGDPGQELVAQLQEKAQMLGTGKVTVHRIHAGFARFDVI